MPDVTWLTSNPAKQLAQKKVLCCAPVSGLFTLQWRLSARPPCPPSPRWEWFEYWRLSSFTIDRTPWETISQTRRKFDGWVYVLEGIRCEAWRWVGLLSAVRRIRMCVRDRDRKRETERCRDYKREGEERNYRQWWLLEWRLYPTLLCCSWSKLYCASTQILAIGLVVCRMLV